MSCCKEGPKAKGASKQAKIDSGAARQTRNIPSPQLGGESFHGVGRGAVQHLSPSARSFLQHRVTLLHETLAYRLRDSVYYRM